MIAPMCEKIHQHGSFFNVDDFSIEDLPEEISHPSTYVWLRNCFPLIVRLLGKGTASGRACLIHQELRQTIQCEKNNCPYLKEFGPNHILYGGIGIITNQHVVTNDKEAAATNIEFFYNSNWRENVVKEYGHKLHTTNRKMDYSMFSCFVHNKELITMVATFDTRRNFSWLTIPKKIRESARKFAIVISHPHGASKRLSIGDVIERKIHIKSDKEYEILKIVRNIYDLCEKSGPAGVSRFEAYWRQVLDIDLPYTVTWYTAPTCRGSSGAPVYMGSTVLEYGEEINQAHTHRGVDNSNGYNNCFT
uniref:Uncharacterized protein n=1 Tax=Arion vulgaris TaxID=1028688 RepID=A0A0B6Z435_9EUPU